MPTYQAFVDVSDTWEEDDINVVSIVAEGESAEIAYQNAIEIAPQHESIQGHDFFVWSISEEDRLRDEL